MFIDDESVNNGEVAEPQNSKDENISSKNNMEDESFWTDETEEAETPEVAEPDEDKSEQPKRQKQTDEDNAKYADIRRKQELENERKVAKELRAKQDEVAKSLGYSSFDEMEMESKSQKYIDQGYDDEMARKLVSLENYEKELQKKLNSARITEEKSKLKDAPYFKDFETEVDAILEHNPNLSVELVFKVVKGENMDKIIAKTQSAIKQKTINDITSKDHIKPDGKGMSADDVNIDEAEFNFYKKLNPRATREDWAKFLKQRKRR